MDHGSTAVPPQEPVRENYVFKAWDTPFDNVTAPLTITAIYEQDPYLIKLLTLSQDGILTWEPIEGVDRYVIQVGEYKLPSAQPQSTIKGGGVSHVSKHTKVIVTAGNYKGVTYVSRDYYGNYAFSEGEVPLLTTPSGFKIVEDKFLVFPRVANDCPPGLSPFYGLYYRQYSVIQTSPTSGDTNVSFNLGGLVWEGQTQIVKMVLFGYGNYGNSVAASIHMNKNADGMLTIIKVE